MPRRRRRDRRRFAGAASLTVEQIDELTFGPQTCLGARYCRALGHRAEDSLPRIGEPEEDLEHPFTSVLVVVRTARPGHPAEYETERRPRCSAFASPLDRRAAWFALRESLLEIESPGSRPWAFYAIELREHPSGRAGEAGWLAERGLLEPDEEAELLAQAALQLQDDGASPYAEAAKIIRARRGIAEPAGLQQAT